MAEKTCILVLSVAVLVTDASAATASASSVVSTTATASTVDLQAALKMAQCRSHCLHQVCTNAVMRICRRSMVNTLEGLDALNTALFPHCTSLHAGSCVCTLQPLSKYSAPLAPILFAMITGSDDVIQNASFGVSYCIGL